MIFFFFLEKTINKFSNSNSFLLINFNFKLKYSINSAKLWCDKILFHLKKKIHIKKVFFYIRSQQSKEIKYKKKNNEYLINYKYPLQGIRLLYSGNF